MKKENVINIGKSALGIVVIYIMAVCLSLFVCDRMDELESKDDQLKRNNQIVLQLK